MNICDDLIIISFYNVTQNTNWLNIILVWCRSLFIHFCRKFTTWFFYCLLSTNVVTCTLENVIFVLIGFESSLPTSEWAFSDLIAMHCDLPFNVFKSDYKIQSPKTRCEGGQRAAACERRASVHKYTDSLSSDVIQFTVSLVHAVNKPFFSFGDCTKTDSPMSLC